MKKKDVKWLLAFILSILFSVVTLIYNLNWGFEIIILGVGFFPSFIVIFLKCLRDYDIYNIDLAMSYGPPVGFWIAIFSLIFFHNIFDFLFILSGSIVGTGIA